MPKREWVGNKGNITHLPEGSSNLESQHISHTLMDLQFTEEALVEGWIFAHLKLIFE